MVPESRGVRSCVLPSLITQEDDVPQKPRPEESGAFVLFLHSGQDQPSGPDAHPDLGPDGKAGGFQPSAPPLNPGHGNQVEGAGLAFCLR